MAGESNPVKDDLIKRGLFTVPSDNGKVGEIKIGEIEQLVKDNVYAIDKDGYLQFGPAYTSPASSPITNPSETTVPTTSSQNQQPIEVVSAIEPRGGPVNPGGGSAVEITLKNVGEEPVIHLVATLKLKTESPLGPGSPWEYNFNNVTPSNPLLPNESTNQTNGRVGPWGDFDDSLLYPLTINATLQSGANFVYTKQVQIKAQPVTDQQPLEIVSVLGPIPPFNPAGLNRLAGWTAEITLKNVSDESVVSLSAMLTISTIDVIYTSDFTFDTTSSNPLLPGKTISSKGVLIPANGTVSYSLMIWGTLQNGDAFTYTKPIQITAPKD